MAVFISEYVAERSRLTTFFRLILSFPLALWLSLWSMIVWIPVFIAWFALLVTGRYPEPLYKFVEAYTQANTAYFGYYYLLTDKFPPFDGNPDYPVRLEMEPPPGGYNRLLVLVRIILLIPVAIIAWFASIVISLCAFVAWFVILIMGRQPQGLQDVINWGVGYYTRSFAYALLLTEEWPPIENPPVGSAVGTYY